MSLFCLLDKLPADCGIVCYSPKRSHSGVIAKYVLSYIDRLCHIVWSNYFQTGLLDFIISSNCSSAEFRFHSQRFREPDLRKKNICNIYTKSCRHFEEWLWSPKQQGDAGFFVHERFYDNEILDSRSIRMFQMFKSWWNKIYKHDYSSIFSFKKNLVMKVLIANHIYIALQLQWRFPRPLLTHGVLSLQTELTTSPSWSTWRRWADMRKTCTSTR